MSMYSGLKTQMKAEGVYTPAEYRRVKLESGWLTEKHGQRKPNKHTRNKRVKKEQP